MKAKLTGGQVVAAIFAGLIGNVFFIAGWTALWVVLLGGALLGLLGSAVGGLGSMFDSETFGQLLDGLGGTLGGIVIAVAVGAVVVMLLGVLFSWLILRGGKVRKPGGTTWTSVLVSAVLSLPFLLLYGLIAGNAADGRPQFTAVLLIGTAVTGIPIWLWMTWAHRGYASEFVGQRATATGSVSPAAESSTPDAPAVEKPDA